MSENYLSRFLAELALDDLLDQVPEAAPSAADAACDVAPAPARPFTPGVALGDLRLLPQAERLTYLAVVSDLGDHAFLAVPLSAHSVPADDREMLAEGVSGIGFQVYQVWNRVIADAGVLAKTWKVGALDAAELKRLRAFAVALACGKPVPEELRGLTSVPVTADDDPRWAYFAKEKATFAPFVRDNLAARERREAVAATPIVPLFSFPVGLAAGTEPPDVVRQCGIAGQPVEVEVEWSRQERALRVRVYAAGDPADAFSAALDGWRLVDGEGAPLGAIAGGKCQAACPEGFDGRCALLDAAGDVHPFIVKGE